MSVNEQNQRVNVGRDGIEERMELSVGRERMEMKSKRGIWSVNKKWKQAGASAMRKTLKKELDFFPLIFLTFYSIVIKIVMVWCY